MSKKLEEIMNIAMKLTLEERAKLVGRLLLSLDEPSESEVERLWLLEAERRLQEFREGKVKGIPAEEVFHRVIADISSLSLLSPTRKGGRDTGRVASKR